MNEIPAPVWVAIVAGAFGLAKSMTDWFLGRRTRDAQDDRARAETSQVLFELYESQLIRLSVQVKELNIEIENLTRQVRALRDQVASLGGDPVQ